MTSVEIVRQIAADYQVVLERESVHAMADILIAKSIKKAKLF